MTTRTGSSGSLQPSRLLALSAIGVWAGCILACRAAWSPDGKRIAFPYVLPGTDGKDKETFGLAIHDLTSDTTRALQVLPSSPDGEVGGLGVRWLSDGKRLFVTLLDTKGEDKLEALLLDAESGRVLKRYVVGPSDNDGSLPIVPHALLADRLAFLTVKEGIVRLDLETGERKVEKAPEHACLMEVGGTLFLESQPEGTEGWNVSILDPQTLQTRSLLQMQVTEGEHGKLWPIFAADLDGGRLAFATDSVRKKKGAEILLFDVPGLARGEAKGAAPLVTARSPARVLEVSPRGSTAEWKLWDPLWTRGGQSLVAAYARDIEGSGLENGICEIPLERGEPRFFPLFESKGRSESMLLLSLSPDGGTVAALRSLVKRDQQEDPRAPLLFLLDVHHLEKPVKRIAAPSPSEPAAKDGGKPSER